jgi:pimeloyl-ACP methyl ester carboxylesterase
VYLLHGYTGTDLGYFGDTSGRQLHRIAERVFAAGSSREMILVMPNAMNAYGGSMYSNSVTTGNWEGYVAEDLVAYMDRTYRTLATRESRGLAGHSMGGYGTIRIAMKRPDVFAAIYALSSCCLNEGTVRPPRGGGPSPAESIRSVDEARGNRGAQGTLGACGRVGAESGEPSTVPRPADQERRRCSPPSPSSGRPIRRWRCWINTSRISRRSRPSRSTSACRTHSSRATGCSLTALTRFGVAHTFETYEGDHGNRIPQRLEEKVLPFFSNTLSFDQRRESTRR